MPQLTPTLIQGSDKANEIDDKVMLIVDAIYGFFSATGTPSLVAVDIEHAVAETAEVDGSNYFSNLRAIGAADDNGIRIHDIENDEEFRIRLDGEGQLNGSGTEKPTVIIEVRTDGGGPDAGATYERLISASADGVHLHQEIPAISGGVTGDYELLNRIDFIGETLDDLQDQINAGGISINGQNGVTTVPGSSPLIIKLDTIDDSDDSDIGDVLTLVSGGTGYNWAAQTDTIYAPVYATSGYYNDNPALGNVSWSLRAGTSSGSSWAASGTGIGVPITGKYNITFSFGTANQAATAGTVTLLGTCGLISREAKITMVAGSSITTSFSMTAELTAGNTCNLNIAVAGVSLFEPWCTMTIERMQDS